MADTEARARGSSIETLLAEFSLLFTASNRAETSEDIEKIKKERKRVSRELDRLEIAAINSLVLPPQVEQAVSELESFTKDLIKERERIQKTTEKLKKVDEYLKQAKKILEITSKLFVLV